MYLVQLLKTSYVYIYHHGSIHVMSSLWLLGSMYMVVANTYHIVVIGFRVLGCGKPRQSVLEDKDTQRVAAGYNNVDTQIILEAVNQEWLAHKQQPIQ